MSWDNIAPFVAASPLMVSLSVVAIYAFWRAIWG
jgi:hypothetical protein